AEAKGWHGLRRFRLRRLRKVNGEALLTATGQNLKRLLSKRGRGRRPYPSGAAGSAGRASLRRPAPPLGPPPAGPNRPAPARPPAKGFFQQAALFCDGVPRPQLGK